MTRYRFQVVGMKNLDRKDHVWREHDRAGKVWKCIACGAICADPPPPHPTPESWVPGKWEELTVEDRKLDRQGR